jgi:hypothetical protein
LERRNHLSLWEGAGRQTAAGRRPIGDTSRLAPPAIS